ncbi:hypothetical protein F9K50_12430, partial [bacterium]
MDRGLVQGIWERPGYAIRDDGANSGIPRPEPAMNAHACRFCDRELRKIFVDLGKVPLSNAFLAPENLDSPESFYPLQARVCENCFLVQVPQLQKPEAIFRHYAYFSSYSEGWLLHARDFAAKMIGELGLDRGSRVVEIACNDGYL